MKCKRCGVEIPAARLAALPYTKTCVSCSSEQPVRGHMITPHKTGSHIEIITPAQSAAIRALDSRGGYGANLPMEKKRAHHV